MEFDITNTNRREIRLYHLFTVANIVEGLGVIISLLTIPTDPKNAILGGYSLTRLIIFGTTLAIFALGILLIFNSRKIINLLNKWFEKQNIIHIIKWLGVIAGLCLWVTIWLPAERMTIYTAMFIRIKPLLLWLELFGFQFYLYTKLCIGDFMHPEWSGIISFLKRYLWLWILSFTGIILILILKLFYHGSFVDQLYFVPSAPLTALQMFSALVLFVILFFLEQKKTNHPKTKFLWIVITFLLIWGITFLVWNATPFTCTDDRLGPYPPNNQCYPSINDAVYSIGSHYITLGQGVYNQWLTDKPAYMLFLALAQWLAGQRIDNYITFQVAFLSLNPALLFLLGKKGMGVAGGIFVALLALLEGSNAILLYQKVGSINPKLEATELLTSVFLIVFCLAVFKWFTNPRNHIWAAIAGGILGLAALIRFTPVFILPGILLTYLICNRKKPKTIITGIALFMLTFCLSFAPFVVTSKGTDGTNYYLAKIQDVVSSRYSNKQTITTTNNLQQPREKTPLTQSTALVYTQQNIAQTSKFAILLHFVNNEASSIAVLPVNFSLLALSDQVDQPIWKNTQTGPIWTSNLSIQNGILLLINFIFIVLGIGIAYKRFGIAGLAPLLIQLGYHLGNAVSKTSGGRYLEPVNWAILLYFSMGILSFVIRLVTLCKPTLKVKPIQSGGIGTSGQRTIIPVIGVMCFFLVLGLIPPLIKYLTNKLPQETSDNSTAMAEAKLVETGMVSVQDWKNFYNDPDHLIISGSAFNARYYRSSFYMSGNPSFELMVLGKEHIFVNYLVNVVPDQSFSDGSNVILVGCKIGQDTLWAANRVIIHSFAVIQLDQEKAVLIDPKATWSCQK